MKKIFIGLSILLTLNLNAQITKAEIIATGLTCSMCSNAINKQLKKLPEVENVAIDLNSNTFTVSLKQNNNISPRILKESVQKAGFFVGSMIITINFSNQKIEDNIKIKKDDLNLIFIDTNTKTLNGLTKFKVLDKGYLITKDFKKNQKLYSKYPSYLAENEDDYHLKTI